MTALVSPDVRRWRQWTAMIEDFGGTDEMHGSGHWFLDGDPVPTQDGCVAFVAMTTQTAPGTPDGARVPSTYYWIAAGDGGADDELVGFLNFRHTLNDFLLDQGGHIGYGVRPSARRRGHAAAALRLALLDAPGLGIDRVLVTCDLDNAASRRTIEINGGELEDIRGDRRRYWIAIP
ncbi:GNAT family N-acetyltransferase [Nocardioides sambongensis]|uniref:GNAT family N-acetyltransferase n=1 Tax=Nocardioides sambongensis TaxID=2589074 RepID=UPI001125C486|nr:GNAT family N-acetyltransferase [Nocardioides sambongensis]